ncbi:MAG TPA: aquaporin [Tepidisphaeraceae bacterium]|nr:aquaporin [Tepidisphaeraceae bacterium]
MSDDATTPAAWRLYVIEACLLGTFMISACAFTALLEHPSSLALRAIPSDFARRALIGLAMGATAIALIYSPWGRRSGAHMNPAFTVSFLWLRKISGRHAAGYITGQFAGGFLGLLICRMVWPMLIRHPSVNYVITTPGRHGATAAWAGEFSIAFVLMAVVLLLNQFPRVAKRTGYVAGLLVAIYITFEAPLSGMSMNPARTLGSAIPAGVFTGLWIYFTAPVLGMLAAVELHVLAGKPRHLLCGKLTHCHKIPCIIRCNCTTHAGINGASEDQPWPAQQTTTT